MLLAGLYAVMFLSIAMAALLAADTLATGGIVFGLYGPAFIGGWIEQFGAVIQNTIAAKVGIIASLIIPSESLWRRAAYEMQCPLAGALGVSPFSAVSVPSLLMIAYTALYLLVALYIAFRIFDRRDI